MPTPDSMISPSMFPRWANVMPLTASCEGRLALQAPRLFQMLAPGAEIWRRVKPAEKSGPAACD